MSGRGWVRLAVVGVAGIMVVADVSTGRMDDSRT